MLVNSVYFYPFWTGKIPIIKWFDHRNIYKGKLCKWDTNFEEIGKGAIFTLPKAILRLFKGQLILKCLIGSIVSTKKPTKIFLRISALEVKSKK